VKISGKHRSLQLAVVELKSSIQRLHPKESKISSILKDSIPSSIETIVTMFKLARSRPFVAALQAGKVKPLIKQAIKSAPS
jgi:hypothetical protein